MKSFAWLAMLLVACGSSVDSESDAEGGGGAGSTSSQSASQTTVSSSSATGGPTGSGGSGGNGAGGDGTGGTISAGPLGMNDVSILVPLPGAGEVALLRASDLVASGDAILPRALHDRVLDIPDNPGAIFDTYEDLQVVAVRFDLCDRQDPGPCPEGEDARLRLVFQPVLEASTFDIGFHAFYAIPKGEIADVVATLSALHAIRGTSTSDPLSINETVASNPDYRELLRSLLVEHASPDAIVRLTVMGQESTAAAFRWIFHGLEMQGGQLEPIAIPDADSTVSQVLLLADASYDLTPPVDSPSGILLGLSGPDFAAASSDEQGAALQALVATDNPLTHVPSTIQCASCHLASAALPRRAGTAGVDPLTIPGRYTSGYDLSIDAGISAEDDALVRGFGYRGDSVAITQRVVNETAQVLEEIQARFP